MFPQSQFGLGGPGRSARGFEMFSHQMNLMSLYSAEVPWIRTKKPNSLTITGIKNREDIRWMLVDLLRVSMESVRMGQS